MSIRTIYTSLFVLLIIILLASVIVQNMLTHNKIKTEEESQVTNTNINEALVNNVSEIVIETNDGQESFVLTNTPEYSIQIKKNNNTNIIILTKRL